MIAKTTEKARELFREISERRGDSKSLAELLEQRRKEWKERGNEYLTIEEIDSMIEETRNGR